MPAAPALSQKPLPNSASKAAYMSIVQKNNISQADANWLGQTAERVIRQNQQIVNTNEKPATSKENSDSNEASEAKTKMPSPKTEHHFKGCCDKGNCNECNKTRLNDTKSEPTISEFSAFILQGQATEETKIQHVGGLAQNSPVTEHYGHAGNPIISVAAEPHKVVPSGLPQQVSGFVIRFVLPISTMPSGPVHQVPKQEEAPHYISAAFPTQQQILLPENSRGQHSRVQAPVQEFVPPAAIKIPEIREEAIILVTHREERPSTQVVLQKNAEIVFREDKPKEIVVLARGEKGAERQKVAATVQEQAAIAPLNPKKESPRRIQKPVAKESRSYLIGRYTYEDILASAWLRKMYGHLVGLYGAEAEESSQAKGTGRKTGAPKSRTPKARSNSEITPPKKKSANRTWQEAADSEYMPAQKAKKRTGPGEFGGKEDRKAKEEIGKSGRKEGSKLRKEKQTDSSQQRRNGADASAMGKSRGKAAKNNNKEEIAASFSEEKSKGRSGKNNEKGGKDEVASSPEGATTGKDAAKIQKNRSISSERNYLSLYEKLKPRLSSQSRKRAAHRRLAKLLSAVLSSRSLPLARRKRLQKLLEFHSALALLETG